jgi:hypothetical protein
MTTRDKYEYDDYGYLHVKKAKVPREYGTLEEMLSAAPTPPEVSGLREVSGVEEVKELAAASGKRTLALLSATPPEVEPVAWMLHGVRGGPDHPGVVCEFHEERPKCKNGDTLEPLYTSPPSPKVDEVDLLKSEIEFLTMGFNAAHATCEDLKAELAKIGKPEWDAEGNPLNLEAAARDAYTQMSICGALGEDDYEKALTNLRKFSGES